MRRAHVVVLHPDLPQVLVGVDANDGAPEVRTPDPPATWPELLAAVVPMVPAGAWPLGPDRSVPGLRVHVVQAKQAAVNPGYRWVDAPDPRWPEPLSRVVAGILEEETGARPADPRRAPWMRRNWWTASTIWVDDRLAELGRRRTGPLEIREQGAISAVGRASTLESTESTEGTQSTVWFKAVPPIFAREPAVLALLGQRSIGPVPRVLAMDQNESDQNDGGARLLMDDAGEVPDRIAPGDRPRLAALLAQLQVRTLDLGPQLLAAGCADRSPARLASELVRMAHDGFELHLLEPAERKALRRLIPQLSDQLQALESGPLPSTLVHGDFHPWNVARSPGWSNADAVIIDWTDAAIGPIGVDLVTLGPSSVTAAVRRAYASVWAPHLGEPVQQVDAWLAATRPAGHVVQALGYDLIMDAIEPEARWPYTGAMAAHLRALLAYRS
jgi:Phosphotransferase enzyme family